MHCAAFNRKDSQETANSSLKTDAGGNPLTAHTGHEIREVDLLTENLILDLDGNVMWDENLEPMYAIQCP